MTLVDELCTAAPTVMVIDDLQWADNESLIIWDQLAASVDQLPLLLIATCHLHPRRPEAQQLRAAVIRSGGELITLGPMDEADAAALVTAMVGSPPGEALRQLTAQASGNPLYLHELVDALARERALEIGTAAEVSMAKEQIPASLAAVLSDRLSFVSAKTAEMLRTAVLFGGTFAVTDLAVLLHSPASKLAADLEEAVSAGILVSSGPELAFRHPLIQQALYESMPAALRTALHAEAARELASVGARASIIAQQLSAAGQPGESWARNWLIENAPALAIRAPELAAELLQRELDETPVGDELRDGLVTSLVWVLLAAGSYEEAARQADQALTVMTDPERRAEAYRVLTRAQLGTGNSDDASLTIRKALASADLPRKWQARMLALLAMLQRAIAGDLDASGVTAQEALTAGLEASDNFATAHALTDLWMIRSVRRDDIAGITAKIKSKMDTAKVFGGFVTAVLTFVVSQYATTAPTTTYWAAVRRASLGALAVAILLYFMTLFWYDRLLMPPRFWGILRLRTQDDLPKILRRPPSSAVWVLYQNMQRTWRLLFVPATYAAAIGIIGFAAARIEPSAKTAIFFFAPATALVALTALWGWRSRPILGAQD